MPLLPMFALAAASAAGAMPAAGPTPAPGATGVQCELVPVASTETDGRTRKTYVARCPGLPQSKLDVSYGAVEGIPAVKN